MKKFISKVLLLFGTFVISYFMLMAYGISWQWILSLLAVFFIGLGGIYIGENKHD